MVERRRQKSKNMVGSPTNSFFALLVMMVFLFPLRVWSESSRPSRAEIKRQIEVISQEAGLYPTLLEAIVSVESGYFPYAICVNNPGNIQAFFPLRYENARQLVRTLEEKGASFDVGLAQINITTIKSLGYDPVDMLDPCRYLRAGAMVLKGLISRYGLTWKAVWKYNGSRQYALRVYRILSRNRK